LTAALADTLRTRSDLPVEDAVLRYQIVVPIDKCGVHGSRGSIVFDSSLPPDSFRAGGTLSRSFSPKTLPPQEHLENENARNDGPMVSKAEEARIPTPYQNLPIDLSGGEDNTACELVDARRIAPGKLTRGVGGCVR
jgi:hypothetical protein